MGYNMAVQAHPAEVGTRVIVTINDADETIASYIRKPFGELKPSNQPPLAPHHGV